MTLTNQFHIVVVRINVVVSVDDTDFQFELKSKRQLYEQKQKKSFILEFLLRHQQYQVFHHHLILLLVLKIHFENLFVYIHQY